MRVSSNELFSTLKIRGAFIFAQACTRNKQRQTLIEKADDEPTSTSKQRKVVFFSFTSFLNKFLLTA